MAVNHHIEPALQPVAIRDLRPTQMTVGLREVRLKREEWRKRRKTDASNFLGQHMIPVVMGPGDSWWLIDHHHLALALHDEGVEHVLVSVVAKLSGLTKKRFFTVMDNRNWLHPYDETGKRHDWAELPRLVTKMVDDPYRSLAGEVRRMGGYAKNETPYSEFLWADFFRDRIRRHQIEAKFSGAVKKGITLARSHDASYLPGFSGPA